MGGTREKYPVPGRLVSDLIAYLLVPELRQRKAKAEAEAEAPPDEPAEAEAEADSAPLDEYILGENYGFLPTPETDDGGAGNLLKFKD